MKNPLLLWLERKGYVDSSFAVVPFARKQIAEREGRLSVQDGVEPDLLDRMLVLKENNPGVLDETEVVKTCAMLVFAGSDTS